MTAIYLAEIEGWNPATSAVVTLRYASGTGYNHPTAPGFYDPRIQQPGNIQRTAFAAGTTAGAVEIGFGALVLTNLDGALDPLIDYGFDGRRLRVLVGDDAAAYATFRVLFSGTMEQARFSVTAVEFLVRDRLFELDKPVQPAKYGGTNALPAGLDGTEELKGRPIPLAYGVVRGAAPPLVNAARLIYQLSAGAIASATLYDGGLALTAGAAYADQAAMEATAPAPGECRILSTAGGSYARLGDRPAGQVTADITQGATAAARTAAQILQALATGPGGIAPADVVAADVTALDAANAAEIGLWLAEEATVREAMTQVAASVGAWFGFDRLGRLRLRRIEAPSGTAAATLTRIDRSAAIGGATVADIVSIERDGTADNGAGVPAYRVRLEYRRNHTPLSGDAVVATIAAAARAELAQEWRTVTATDAAVQTKHPLAPELAFRTLIDDAAAAQAEADRLLALRKVRRDRLRIRAWLAPDLIDAIDLGAVLRVQLPRFGYDAGKLFVVIGIQSDAVRQIVDLDLWG